MNEKVLVNCLFSSFRSEKNSVKNQPHPKKMCKQTKNW